jgi:hypothetical protein
VPELQQRAARGVALATLAVACVVVGPAPQLTQALERTYAVALADRTRERHGGRRRVPSASWRRSPGPRASHPGRRRP